MRAPPCALSGLEIRAGNSAARDDWFLRFRGGIRARKKDAQPALTDPDGCYRYRNTVESKAIAGQIVMMAPPGGTVGRQPIV
jgi:hypothetical protein